MKGIWVVERRLKSKGAEWQFWIASVDPSTLNPTNKKEALESAKDFAEFGSAEYRVVRYGRIEK